MERPLESSFRRSFVFQAKNGGQYEYKKNCNYSGASGTLHCISEHEGHFSLSDGYSSKYIPDYGGAAGRYGEQCFSGSHNAACGIPDGCDADYADDSADGSYGNGRERSAFPLRVRRAEKQLPFWLAAGAVLKAVVLWLLVWYVMLPFFGAGVPEPMQLVVKTTFSVTQFITAAVGGVIAYIVYGRVRNAVNR